MRPGTFGNEDHQKSFIPKDNLPSRGSGGVDFLPSGLRAGGGRGPSSPVHPGGSFGKTSAAGFLHV